MGPLEWLIILTAQSPALIFWIIVLVLGIVMLRRSGGRAERFFTAGAGVKLGVNLLKALWSPVSLSYYRDFNDYAAVSTAVNIILNVIGMAGILLLLYAFWRKFHEMRKTNEHVENI